MNSQIITYPSVVEKLSNITVVVVDADVNDVAEIVNFCQGSYKNYDVYLYKQDIDDLQWLHSVAGTADQVLINADSTVTIEHLNQILKFGVGQTLNTPLAYFQEIDTK